ncbi:MAG: hypothetical protein WAU02_01365 [Candidatus Saccharimonadales bacterium]
MSWFHTYHRHLHRHRRWPFTNTLLLVLSIVLCIELAQSPLLDVALHHIGRLGYVGAVIVGVFMASTFTVAPAMIVLFHIAAILNPLGVAVLAGAGAMIGDVVLFRLLRDGIFEEWEPIVARLTTPHMKKLFKTPYFGSLLPVLGALIIASPLPDELGIGLLGASHIKQWQFVIITFVLNAAGIFAIIWVAQLFR